MEWLLFNRSIAKENNMRPKDTVAVMAAVAGLQDVLVQFPDDVRIAAEEAAGFVSELITPVDPSDESWPPMRVGVGR